MGKSRWTGSRSHKEAVTKLRLMLGHDCLTHQLHNLHLWIWQTLHCATIEMKSRRSLLNSSGLDGCGLSVCVIVIFHSQDSFPLMFRPQLWETSSGVVAVGVFAAEAPDCRCRLLPKSRRLPFSGFLPLDISSPAVGDILRSGRCRGSQRTVSSSV